MDAVGRVVDSDRHAERPALASFASHGCSFGNMSSFDILYGSVGKDFQVIPTTSNVGGLRHHLLTCSTNEQSYITRAAVCICS